MRWVYNLEMITEAWESELQVPSYIGIIDGDVEACRYGKI